MARPRNGPRVGSRRGPAAKKAPDTCRAVGRGSAALAGGKPKKGAAAEATAPQCSLLVGSTGAPSAPTKVTASPSWLLQETKLPGSQVVNACLISCKTESSKCQEANLHSPFRRDLAAQSKTGVRWGVEYPSLLNRQPLSSQRMGSEDTPVESPSAFGCNSGGKKIWAQAALPAQLCLPGPCLLHPEQQLLP